MRKYALPCLAIAIFLSVPRYAAENPATTPKKAALVIGRIKITFQNFFKENYNETVTSGISIVFRDSKGKLVNFKPAAKGFLPGRGCLFEECASGKRGYGPF